MKRVKYVLDASAILSGKDFSAEYDLYSSPLVTDEIRHGRMRRRLEYLIEAGLRIVAPSKQNIDSIKRVAELTGDIGRVSEADIEVLALTTELDAFILTNDYSIQNLAKEMGINYRSISEEGITEVYKWTYRCKGCGRYWEVMQESCPVCGSELKSVRRR